MTTRALKKSVKNDVIRPFALSTENPWLRIAYRFDPAESWQNALVTPFIVLPSNREDVRSDVLHSFEIGVDVDAVRNDGIDLGDVDLIVLTRDNFAKKIVRFWREPLSSEATAVFDVPRSDLEMTSLSARVDFVIMLAARRELTLGSRKVRRGGRLAAHILSVSAESKGHSFNFSKTKKEEFIALGLPGTTTFQLQLPRLLDLIEPCDDVSSALSVLVHEDAWSTLQEIRNGDRIGEALGTMFLCDLVVAVFAAAREALRDDTERRTVEDGSIVKRMLAWISEGTDKTPEELEQSLTDESGLGGLSTLQAFTQAKLRATNAIHRIQLVQEESV